MVEDGTFGQYSAILESDHRDKESDTGSESVLKWGGHHLEDDLAHVADTKQHK